jgi:cytochrome c556
MARVLCRIALALAVALPALATGARAQEPFRVDDDQVKQILDRTARDVERFRKSLDSALDRSPVDGTRREDDINRFMKDFDQAAERMHDRFGDHNQATGYVSEVLRRAQVVDDFMLRHDLSPAAENDWSAVRTDLDNLALAYQVRWDWTGSPVVSREGDKDVKNLVSGVETAADRFKTSLKSSLEDGMFEDRAAREDVYKAVRDFEAATDRWKSHFGDHDAATTDAADVLRRAATIDAFMRDNPLTPAAQSDWAALRAQLDLLAGAYNVPWDWNAVP